MRVPRLHAITDDARLADARFVRDAAAVLEAGGADLALHLRGRKTTAARLYDLTAQLLPLARGSGARLLVNDRVDVALAAQADGAHLREDSLDPALARAILGPDALIGVSRHQGSATLHAEADYIIFGPVHATASHPGEAAVGVDALRSAASGGEPKETPLIAIGGVTPERVQRLLEGGAHGVAALSGIWQGGAASVRAYLDALPRRDRGA